MSKTSENLCLCPFIKLFGCSTDFSIDRLYMYSYSKYPSNQPITW